MKYQYSIITNNLAFEVEITTKDTKTHSISTSDKEISAIIDQGVHFLRGLLKNHDILNRERLEKVGK